MPYFGEIAQNAAEIWRFFNFLRWRPSAILDFQKLEISTSGPIRRPNMRHRTKFGEGWSNHSRDMADFRFFKMAAAAILKNRKSAISLEWFDQPKILPQGGLFSKTLTNF